MLDVALARASEGFRVFPLEPGGKVPTIKGWQDAATTDPARIEAWWWDPVMEVPLGYNVGVATGRGLVVVDVDMKNGKDGEKSLRLLEMLFCDLPATHEVRTPTGGRHLYFRSANPVRSRIGFMTGIDIKGEGGFVVAEGSVVDGGVYARIG